MNNAGILLIYTLAGIFFGMLATVVLPTSYAALGLVLTAFTIGVALTRS